MVQYFPVITGSLTVQGNVLITGSINTTAGITGSFSGTATTAQTASSVANLNQNVQITGSLTTSGTITAQTLNVQQVTSSIVYSSGSNVFGNSSSNTQVFTGSLFVSGGNINITSVGMGINATPSGYRLNVGGGAAVSNLLVGSGYRVEFADAGSTSWSWIEGSSYDRGYSYIAFNTSGSEKARLTSAGNFGIGVTSPAFPLEVSSSTTGLLGRFTSNQNEAQIRLVNNSAGGRTYSLGSGGSSSAGARGFYIYDETAATTVFAISGSGNVGIGTTALTSVGAYKVLALNGTDGSIIDLRFNGSDNGRLFSSSTTAVGIESLSTTLPLEFKTQNGGGSTVRMAITPAGIVQIGAAGTTGQALNTANAGIANTNTYLGTGQLRVGGGSDHGSNTVLSVAPGVVYFDRPGVGGGALTINSSGYVLTPQQPAFYAYIPGGSTTTSTGNFAGFTSTRLNRGSCYNTSTGRFTAPVAGVYRFLFAALYRQQGGNAAGEISISINGSNVNTRGLAYATAAVLNAHIPCIAELIISLNANDYVMPFIFSVGAGSDWYMGENLAYFCGYLIG